MTDNWQIDWLEKWEWLRLTWEVRMNNNWLTLRWVTADMRNFHQWYQLIKLELKTPNSKKTNKTLDWLLIWPIGCHWWKYNRTTTSIQSSQVARGAPYGYVQGTPCSIHARREALCHLTHSSRPEFQPLDWMEINRLNHWNHQSHQTLYQIQMLKCPLFLNWEDLSEWLLWRINLFKWAILCH